MIRRLTFLPLKIGALSASLSLFAGQAEAATFSVIPSADAFVSTGATGTLSGNNYGGAGALALSASGLPQGELQSAMQFNLSGALASFNSTFGAGQWSIESVTLQLTASTPNNGIFNASAAGVLGVSWMQNDAWQEGTGSPAAPGASGITFTSLLNNFTSPSDENLGTFSFSGATTGTFTYPLGLPSGFTADLLAGGNLSLRLRAADATVSGVFNSRTFNTAASRPTLTIVAVPEPASAALAGFSALLLLAHRRTRQDTAR